MLIEDAPPKLPLRDPRGHKGTFGTVAVIGGCARRPSDEFPGVESGLTMLGGPTFSALAALRAGAGLVRLALPQPLIAHALTLAPHATGVALSVDHEGDLIPHLASQTIDAFAGECQALLIGPGLGVSPGAQAATLRVVGQDERPAIVDADAINLLSMLPDLHKDLRAPAVLTPHVGEYRRLAAALGIEIDPESDLPGAAEALAQKLGCIIALKAAATAVSDGQRTWVHDRPNPVLAVGGSGDVLAGVIAGFAAQHARRPIIAGQRTLSEQAQGGLSLFDCARLGVLAHAAAARAWADSSGATGGMLASELLDQLPRAVESLRAAPVR